jgi:hypothetical protein
MGAAAPISRGRRPNLIEDLYKSGYKSDSARPGVDSRVLSLSSLSLSLSLFLFRFYRVNVTPAPPARSSHAAFAPPPILLSTSSPKVSPRVRDIVRDIVVRPTRYSASSFARVDEACHCFRSKRADKRSPASFCSALSFL